MFNSTATFIADSDGDNACAHSNETLVIQYGIELAEHFICI